MTTKHDGSYISMGMQAGDKAAGNAFGALLVAINRAFTEKCSRGYGGTLTSLGFVLRVDGEIWYWGKDGCDKVAGRRIGTATVDMYVSKATWQGATALQLKSILVKLLREGLVLMLMKLKHLGVEFDEEHLVSDFNDAIEVFDMAHPK